MTRAARQLGPSQSALSHQLARLREVFDDPLVVRGGPGVVATPRAQALAEPLSHALAELERALAPDDGWDPATARRVFTVAIPDHYTPLVLARVLPRIEREAPGIDIHVRPAGGDAQPLEQGRLDLVFGGTAFAASTLKSRAFITARFACAVRHDHPTVGDTLDLDAYCALGHLRISPRGAPSGVVDGALEEMGRGRRIRATTPSFLAAPLVLASSDLVLTAPRRLLEFMEDRAELRLLDPPDGLALPTFRLGLSWHPRMHTDPGHTWLRSMIADAFAVDASFVEAVA